MKFPSTETKGFLLFTFVFVLVASSLGSGNIVGSVAQTNGISVDPATRTVENSQIRISWDLNNAERVKEFYFKPFSTTWNLAGSHTQEFTGVAAPWDPISNYETLALVSVRNTNSTWQYSSVGQTIRVDINSIGDQGYQVSTRYEFNADSPIIKVERTFGFGSKSLGPSRLNPYYLRAYNRNNFYRYAWEKPDGTVAISQATCEGGCSPSNWAQTWIDLEAPGLDVGLGLVNLSGNPPAQPWLDRDANSQTAWIGVAIPNDGFSEDLTVSYLIIPHLGDYAVLETLIPEGPWPPDPRREPVILLPGIGGSEIAATRQFDLSVPDGHGGTWVHTYSSGDTVWPDVGRALLAGNDDYFDALKLKADGQTPVTPRTDDLEITELVKIELPLLGEQAYGDWTPFFEARGYQSGVNLFEFPFDFRLDISEVLDELDDQVIAALIAANSGETDENQWQITQVNLVTHSMGGTVARAFINDPARAARVHRVISLAPAYLGGPRFFRALLLGESFGPPGLNPEELKDVIQNWPGAFEVSPSRMYWEFYDGSDPVTLAVPFREDRDFDEDGETQGALNYDQTKAMLARVGTNMTVFDLSEKFHNALDTSWDTGVPVPEVHIISGSGHCTPGQLWVNHGLGLVPGDSGPTPVPVPVPSPRVALRYVNGDGTVPLFSTTLYDPARGIDHRGGADGAQIYYTNLTHSTIHQPSRGTAMDFVASLLEGIPQIPSDFLQGPSVVRCTQISVASPVELHVFDDAGNHTGRSGPNEYVFEEDIPGSAYDEIGQSKSAVVEQDGAYTIELRALAEGAFDLKISDYEDGHIIQTILFLRAPLTPTTVGHLALDTTASEPPILLLDHDNDGIIDEEVTYAAILDPAQSLDSAPPSVAIHSPTEGSAYAGGIRISWSASDDVSGVLNEFGVLDAGTPEALVVENGAVADLEPGRHTLTVAAEDRAGNGAVEEVGFMVFLLDINPGSDTNCFNINDAVVPVAILTTDTFDAATVDPFTLALEAAGVGFGGQSGSAGSLEDVDGDGDLDLVVEIQDTDGNLQPGDAIATLTGVTFDGTSILGRDTICIEEEPTAVTLASFAAQAASGSVVLAWETGTEIDNAGFNLYRATSADGPWTKITDALIAAQGDAVAGASYSFADAPGYGTFFYKLEDVDYHGVSEMHGPVKVSLILPFRRPLHRPTLPR